MKLGDTSGRRPFVSKFSIPLPEIPDVGNSVSVDIERTGFECVPRSTDPCLNSDALAHPRTL